jgi:late competence protein required for DNA uptake (superfamily II DNA/RNA helicase)
MAVQAPADKILIEVPMMKSFPKTGKQTRPKTAVKGKRYRCAKCRKRSPKPVKTPAPWYCPNCSKVGSANEGEVA